MQAHGQSKVQRVFDLLGISMFTLVFVDMRFVVFAYLLIKLHQLWHDQRSRKKEITIIAE